VIIDKTENYWNGVVSPGQKTGRKIIWTSMQLTASQDLKLL